VFRHGHCGYSARIGPPVGDLNTALAEIHGPEAEQQKRSIYGRGGPCNPAVGGVVRQVNAKQRAAPQFSTRGTRDHPISSRCGAQLPRNPRRKGSFQQLQTTPRTRLTWTVRRGPSGQRTTVHQGRDHGVRGVVGQGGAEVGDPTVFGRPSLPVHTWHA
jgi:hypothetical protein